MSYFETKVPLKNFEDFMSRLNTLNDQFIIMLYSNTMMHQYLKGSRPEFEELFVTAHYDSEKGFLLNRKNLVGVIAAYTIREKKNWEYSITSFLIKNGHLNRTAIINHSFELIYNYVFECKKDRSLLENLQKYDWFKVFYLMRNNASHFDNLGKTIPYKENKFPWFSDTEIKWETISILKEQIGHEIRYDDVEVCQLLDTAINFFETEIIFH